MLVSFPNFGPVHLMILCSVPALAAALAVAQRTLLRESKAIRYGLVVLLLLSTGSYYGSFVAQGARMFPDHVPLELCDVSLWLVIYVLLTLKPWAFDLAYYWAVAGASMALLTPNIVRPTVFQAVQFFADHGLIVVATLYLVWSGQARPRPGSAGRALLWLNLIAIPVGAFDLIYKTDYMFLRVKPPTVSLLDVMGPWPWYLVSCEGVGLVLFLLLYLPFRRWRVKAGESRSDGSVALEGAE